MLLKSLILGNRKSWIRDPRCSEDDRATIFVCSSSKICSDGSCFKPVRFKDREDGQPTIMK
jgi:hypothetical protein